ncbi:MAG: molybdopterin molybdotransferase MoeA [Terriglobales bacterium]
MSSSSEVTSPQAANSPAVNSQVLTFEDARHLVEQHAAVVAPRDSETLDLLTAYGRVLAEEIKADRDFPPFDRAARDGYAVRAADVTNLPVRLQLVGELKAGDWPDPRSCRVERNQAIGIMTGAPLPSGADAVVMVEHTVLIDASVEVHRSVTAGENFVPRASEARAGQLLLARGQPLHHAAIAIAASVGKQHVQVFRKPRVAVLSTGDEVVDIDATPGPAQIRNSNSYSLAVQIQNAGGEAVRLAIAPDERTRLKSQIEAGLQYDLLLLTGGVSMGKYDLVEQVLAELNAEFYFTGAKIQPGRPVVFGSCSSNCGAGVPARVSAANPPSAHLEAFAEQKKYFFGLPGNPVSTMVTFELFARPMIEALSGAKPQPLIFVSARLKAEVRAKTGLKRFLPAILSGEFENAEVELVHWQGSGDIATLARANCYLVVPPDRERIDPGEWVSLLMR